MRRGRGGRMPNNKLPPIVKDRYYVDVGSMDKPVYLTSSGGHGVPDDVWTKFEKAEQAVLSKIRGFLSKGCMGYSLEIYMIWPDLTCGSKFCYHYHASSKIKDNQVILSITRTPAMEVKNGV